MQWLLDVAAGTAGSLAEGTRVTLLTLEEVDRDQAAVSAPEERTEAAA
jgi:hypothetical protein